MKRFIFVTAALLAGLLTPTFQTDCKAEDSSSLISKIEAANSTAKIRTGNFTEERKRKGKEPQNLAGKLTFDPAGKLSMAYSTPAGDFFNITGGFIEMKNNGAENKFDLSKNKPMKGLADLLISSFSGKLNVFAAQNSCTINAEKDSDISPCNHDSNQEGGKGLLEGHRRLRPEDTSPFFNDNGGI